MPRIAAPPLNMTPSSSSSRDQFGHIQSTDQLHCELAACRSDERALAVLRGYIAPRSENKRACDKVLNEVEVKVSRSLLDATVVSELGSVAGDQATSADSSSHNTRRACSQSRYYTA